MIIKLLTEHHLEFLSLKGVCRGSSESTLVKMSNCSKLLELNIINELGHSLRYNLMHVCAPVEDTDQLAHSRSLTRIFARCCMGSQCHNDSSYG